MATIPFTTSLTLNTDATTIDFEVASFTTEPESQGEISDIIYNLITDFASPNSFDFSATLFPNILQIGSPPYTINLTSDNAGFGSEYNDGVYQYIGSFDDAVAGNTYESESYLLVTYGIDAAMAAWPTTTGRQQATLDWAETKYAEMQGFFTAEDYVETNRDVLILRAIIVRPYTQMASLDGTLVNTDNTDLEVSLDPVSFTFLEGYYNQIENTLTGDLSEFTWEFDATNVATQTHNLVPSDMGYTSVFLDGVYKSYISALLWVDDGDYDINVNSGRLFFGNYYALITTTIDTQIALFEANVQAGDTAGQIALAELLANQTAWAAAYADEDYDTTNDLLAASQAILANGLTVELFASLASKSTMTVYFESLPSGVYTNATGLIQNTLTGVEFSFDGFPASNLDLTTILNSETLGFGTDFPDGVYQITVNFYVDGLLMTGMCYLAVTSDWQCCIDKAAAKKCGSLNTALMQANLNKAVRAVNVYSDINTANALISEGNRECSGCGCGCS